MKLKIFQCKSKSVTRLRLAVCLTGAGVLIFIAVRPFFGHGAKELILRILTVCGFMFF